MADYDDNQRPAVVGAIVLAAVLAGALWYFFVFRNSEPEELAFSPTPTATSAPEITPLPQEEPTQVIATPTPGVPATIAGEQVAVAPTSATGPAETVLAGTLAAIVSGLVGLRHARKQLKS